jgi:hypothetical protein
MTRSGFFLAVCLIAVVAFGSLCIARNHGGEGEQSIENALAVQKAVVVARDYLMREEPKKAVDVLEANLSRINGDRKYLALLRDAYRAYIKDLALTNQPALVELYQTRLKILGNQELGQPVAEAVAVVGPPAPEPKAPAEKFAPAAKTASLDGSAAKTALETAASSTSAPDSKVVVSTTALVSARPKSDPFDGAHELKLAASGFPQKLDPSDELLVQADEEFAKERYAAAKLLYERVFQADAKSLNDDGRKRWAYCQLKLVVDQVNRSPKETCDWGKLESEVKTAVNVAPNLAKTGDEILTSIALRKGMTPAPVVRSAMPTVAVKHLPRGNHGWLVAETAHFRILHNQTKEFAENVAQTAEFTRSQMSRKWFGKEDEDWSPKCDIYLHAGVSDYTQQTGQPASSPGHSKIDLDPRASRVVGRVIHLRCDNATLLDCVLPHETTHVVLAGHFGSHHVPRWADEGIAVLSEPAEKVQQHRKNLARSIQSHELIPLQQLLEMNDYPSAQQISTFYAQSVALVDFLTRQKSPAVLAQFVRDGLQGGYERAVQQHYGYQSIRQLQDSFTERMLAETGGSTPGFGGHQ